MFLLRFFNIYRKQLFKSLCDFTVLIVYHFSHFVVRDFFPKLFIYQIFGEIELKKNI